MSTTYTVKYLPVDKPLTDGCIVIDRSGKNFVFNSYTHHHMEDDVRVAELFLVAYDYNQPVVVGRPAPASLKWVKPGIEVTHGNCEFYPTNADDQIPTVAIRCPCCGSW